MSRRISFTVGDGVANLDVMLRDRATGVGYDVSTAAVNLKFRREGETTLLDTIVAELLPGRVLSNGVVDSPVATIGKYGRVRFDMTDVLNNDPGHYEGEIVILWPGVLAETLDERIKFSLREGL